MPATVVTRAVQTDTRASLHASLLLLLLLLLPLCSSNIVSINKRDCSDLAAEALPQPLDYSTTSL